MPHLTPIQTARAIAKLEEKLVVGFCGEKITLHLQFKEGLAKKQACKVNTNRCWKDSFTKVYFHVNMY
jgi:hypothetical protein